MKINLSFVEANHALILIFELFFTYLSQIEGKTLFPSALSMNKLGTFGYQKSILERIKPRTSQSQADRAYH